jgi:hypothetical protein
MYLLMKAILEAQSANGEDGQELVNGALLALHEFIRDTCGVPLDAEWDRVTKLLRAGDRAELVS